MKHIRKFNEIFSTLSSLVGKGAGVAAQSIPKLSMTSEKDKKDTDLGEEILNHLNAMSTDYNRSGDYNEKTVNKLNSNWYYFIDSIFKSGGGKHKVDVIKHLDFRTKNVPEYTITISKLGITSNQYQNRLSGRSIRVRDTEGGKHDTNSYRNPNIQESSERLKISPDLAKKIFSACENIYQKVTKNTKDDARGK